MGPKKLYLGEEAVVGTVVQAEVQSEISLPQAELVEARGKKAIPVNTESPKRSPEVVQELWSHEVFLKHTYTHTLHLAGKMSWERNGELSNKEHRSCLLTGNNNEVTV